MKYQRREKCAGLQVEKEIEKSPSVRLGERVHAWGPSSQPWSFVGGLDISYAEYPSTFAKPVFRIPNRDG